MKSSRMVEDFPYASKAICYIEIRYNRVVSQIDNKKEQIEVLLRVLNC